MLSEPKLTLTGFAVHTLVDPLYEPLRFKLNTWCDCLERMGGERLGLYGVTPYVLLDAVRLRQLQEAGILDDVIDVEPLYQKVKSLLEAMATPAVTPPLRDLAADVRSEHKTLRTAGQDAITQALFGGKKVDENRLFRALPLFQMERALHVECPKCGEVVGMSEHTRILEILRNLQASFEVRRSRWLLQAGALQNVLPSATHTRHAHMVGTLIAGVNALTNITIYPANDIALPLGDYLLIRGIVHEFLAAAFLHDLGHPPFSHVLERNPFVLLDHEEITRSLVCGKPDAPGKTCWYALSFYLQRVRAALLSGGAAETRSDEAKTRGSSGDPERAVYDAILSAGLNPDLIADMLRREAKAVAPRGRKETRGRTADRCAEHLARRDMCCVHRLLDSPIDLDRIDHIRRDSTSAGLSLSSFRVRELLQGITIVYRGSSLWKDFETAEEECCFLLCGQALMYAVDMLSARALIFREVLFSEENNFISGVVNQLVGCGVRMLPHLAVMLPFATDQVVTHLLTDEEFVGSQVEKLNRLLQGKGDRSCYFPARHFQVRANSEESDELRLRDFFVEVEGINDSPTYQALPLPAVVVHLNVKIARRGETTDGEATRAGAESNRTESPGGGREPVVLDLDRFRKRTNLTTQGTWEPWLLLDERYSTRNGSRRVFTLPALVGTGHKLIAQTRVPPMPSESENNGLLTIWVHRGVGKGAAEKMTRAVVELVAQAASAGRLAGG